MRGDVSGIEPGRVGCFLTPDLPEDCKVCQDGHVDRATVLDGVAHTREGGYGCVDVLQYKDMIWLEQPIHIHMK